MAQSRRPTVRIAPHTMLDSDEPQKSTRPCPLCREPLEVTEQAEPQLVICGSCGLRSTIEAIAPPVAVPAPTVIEIVEVPPAVSHWLERQPRPLRPELSPEAMQARQRRRRLAAGAAAGVVAIVALAAVAGHRQASHRFAQHQATERAQARQNESRLLELKSREEAERQAAELARLTAERETRLVTAKYLAAQAQDITGAHCWQAVAASIAAVRTTLVPDQLLLPEAHQSLRDALARCPDVYGLGAAALGGHVGGVTVLAASPDGRWLATGGMDHDVRLWDLRQEPIRRPIILSKHAAPVSHLLFSPDRRWLITGGRDSAVCVWDVPAAASQASPTVLPGRDGRISNLAVSSNGRWLAVVFASLNGKSDAAMLWDLSAGPERATSLALNGAGGRIQSAAISPNSRWLALGVDEAIHLWDLEASVPAIASVSRRCQYGVAAAVFSNDGKWLITSGLEGASNADVAAQLWNLGAEDPSTSIVLRGHAGSVRTLAISADSRLLVTAGADQALRVWDLQSPDPALHPRQFRTGRHPITNTAISADGRWLAASHDNGDVHLWDLASTVSPESPVVLRGDAGAITSLAFTPSASLLATAGADSAVRVWNLDVYDLMNRATAVAAARKASVAARYAALNPSGTIAGKLLQAQFRESNLSLALKALAEASPKFQRHTASICSFVLTNWRNVRSQLHVEPKFAGASAPTDAAPIKIAAAADAIPTDPAIPRRADVAPAPSSVVVSGPSSAQSMTPPRSSAKPSTLRVFLR